MMSRQKLGQARTLQITTVGSPHIGTVFVLDTGNDVTGTFTAVSSGSENYNLSYAPTW